MNWLCASVDAIDAETRAHSLFSNKKPINLTFHCIRQRSLLAWSHDRVPRIAGLSIIHMIGMDVTKKSIKKYINIANILIAFSLCTDKMPDNI